MLAYLLIAFREALEAGLIVGIVMAATVGLAGRMKWILGGIAAGVIGASILAVFAGALSNALSGYGQEYFDAAVLLAAVCMLAWHHLWMADHGRDLARQLKQMGADIKAGQSTLFAMAMVVALAILREGAELVLFLYGIFAASHDGIAPLVTGAVGGIALGALVSYGLYRGLKAIPTKRLFQITGVMLTLLAAGLAGQAFAILAQVGAVPTLGDQVWDTSWLLPDSNLLGKALHALVGYSDRPVGVQVIAYLVTLIVFVAAGKLVRRAHAAHPSKPALASKS